MEAARLGLQDFQLGSLSAAFARSPPGLGLPGCDPWPALGPSPLSTLSHALPGFLSHPQAAYASYLTPPSGGLSSLHQSLVGHAPHMATPPSGSFPLPTTSSGPSGPDRSTSSPAASSDSGKISPGHERLTKPSGFASSGSDHRTSIESLRLRAKEQLDMFKEDPDPNSD